MSPSPFHEALAARPDYWNALFRRDGRGVDPQAFLAHLAEVIGPLVDELAADDLELAGTLTACLYPLSLRAHRKHLLDADGLAACLARVFDKTLRLLLPRFPGRHNDVAIAVSNAALRLERVGPENANAWLEAMETWGPECSDIETLFNLGLVLAWREGAAEFRLAAQDRFEQLSPIVRRAILGTERLELSAERRFASPLTTGALGYPEVIARVGGFVGFGGVFRDPPLVVSAEGRLYAFDSKVTTELHADAYGVCLRAVASSPDQNSTESAESTESERAYSVKDRGEVRLHGAEAELPLLAESSSSAYADGVLAVTLERSHFVFVVGRRPALE